MTDRNIQSYITFNYTEDQIWGQLNEFQIQKKKQQTQKQHRKKYRRRRTDEEIKQIQAENSG